MDKFKKETCVDYTANDLNCRSIVPHNRNKNIMEKLIKRKARRKNKLFLKKYLTKETECDNI